jgi:hypothetical protein
MRGRVLAALLFFPALLTGCLQKQFEENARNYHERILRHEMRIARFIEQMNEAIEIMKCSPAELAMKQQNLELQKQQINALRELTALLDHLRRRRLSLSTVRISPTKD